MITGKNIYDVLSALVPLYVAMFLAYGSVKWWKIFTPEQCSGINRFVSVFAVPFLSFRFIMGNNPYTMNFKFIAADSLQKVVILVVLAVWQCFDRTGRLDRKITFFSLSTLPNTLVMGVPLLGAMYGPSTKDLMIQVVVMQSIVWYTLLLFMFEYKAGKALISEQFPETASAIISIKVESDVVSLSGREPIEADSEIGEDGKIHVVLRKSSSVGSANSSHWSNLSGAEIFSLESFRESMPRNPPMFNQNDPYETYSGRHSRFMYSPRDGDAYPVHSSRGQAMQSSNLEEELTMLKFGRSRSSGNFVNGSNSLSSWPPKPLKSLSVRRSGSMRKKSLNWKSNRVSAQELHMFVWKSSPASQGNLQHSMSRASSTDFDFQHPSENLNHVKRTVPNGEMVTERILEIEGAHDQNSELRAASSNLKKDNVEIPEITGQVQKPPASVMTTLILIMVWRKLIRNPNTYASIIGLVWSLLAYRWDFEMPVIIDNSISIISNVGLGMAVFSLGLFMALQPKIIACGKSAAAISMLVRFLAGPIVMAATTLAIGIRGNLLRIAIVQAALPEGIVPFVFAKEYDVHAQILSTAVIFGMVVALPVTIIYYILLGL